MVYNLQLQIQTIEAALKFKIAPLTPPKLYVLCSNEMNPELKGSAFFLSLLYDGLSSTNALIGLQNGAEKKILVRVEKRYGEY
jgi:hypothetical protein